MQKTTRLVVLIRRYAAALTMAACLLLPSAAGAAQGGQAAPTVPKEVLGDTWGNKAAPENFVRSKGPAKEGEAYNWVQMGYASIVMVGMIAFMVWLVRRTPARGALDKDKADKE